MRNFILMLPVLTALTGRLFAQGGPQRQRNNDDRIGYISDRLQLTADEAKAFWPLYESWQREKKELRKELNPREVRSAAERIDMTDQEARSILDKMDRFREQELALDRKYRKQLLNVIPPQKLLRLMKVQQEMKRQRQENRGQPSPQRH